MSRNRSAQMKLFLFLVPLVFGLAIAIPYPLNARDLPLLNYKTKSDKGSGQLSPPAPPGPAAPPGNPPFIDASLTFSKLVDQPATVLRTTTIPENGLGSSALTDDDRGRNGGQSEGISGLKPSNRFCNNSVSISTLAKSESPPTLENSIDQTRPVSNETQTETGIEGFKNGSIKLRSKEISPDDQLSPKPFVGPEHQGRIVINDLQTMVAQGPTKPPKPVHSARGRCPYPVPAVGSGQKKCVFTVTKNRNLNIFDGHDEVSMCETMVAELGQCESICADVPECQAIHYCGDCSGHNCRLLSESKDGPSKLPLVDRFDFVDYSEKGKCGS